MSFRRVVIRSAVAVSLLVGLPSAGFAIYSHIQADKESQTIGHYLDRLMKDDKAPKWVVEQWQWSASSAGARQDRHQRNAQVAAWIAWPSTLGVWLLALTLLWIAKRPAGQSLAIRETDSASADASEPG